MSNGRIIVTIGTVGLSEEFEFQSSSGLKWGDVVKLRVTKPMAAKPYGDAIVKEVVGPAKAKGLYTYKATRVY